MTPGVHLYGARVVAEGGENEVQLVGDVVGLRLFLALSAVFVVVLAGIALGIRSTVVSLVVLYALSLVPMALQIDWFYQGKESMTWIGWGRLILNVSYLGALLFFVRTTSDLTWTPVAFFAGYCVSVSFLLTVFRSRYGTLRVRWNPASLFTADGSWSRILRQSLPLGLGTSLTQASYNFSPLILGIVSTPAMVGYFGAALRVVFFLLVFDRLITTVLLPAVSRYHHQSPEKLGPMLSLVLKMILMIIVPVAMGGFLLAGPLMEVIYGHAFSPAVGVFQILLLYFFSSAASSVYVYGLIGTGQERRYSAMMVYGTIVQVLAIVVGSVTGNALGAAAGYAVGEGVILVLMQREFSKMTDLQFWRLFLRPFAASLVMGFVLYALNAHALSYAVPVGAVVYFAVLIVIRGFTREDFATLKAKVL